MAAVNVVREGLHTQSTMQKICGQRYWCGWRSTGGGATYAVNAVFQRSTQSARLTRYRGYVCGRHGILEVDAVDVVFSQTSSGMVLTVSRLVRIKQFVGSKVICETGFNDILWFYAAFYWDHELVFTKSMNWCSPSNASQLNWAILGPIHVNSHPTAIGDRSPLSYEIIVVNNTCRWNATNDVDNIPKN